MAVKRSTNKRESAPRRSNNSYRRKKKVFKSPELPSGWFFVTSAVVLSAVLLSAMSFSCLYAYRLLTSTGYFAAKQIEIQGIHMLSDDTVISISEIGPGTNLLSANIEKVEQRLLENNWVKNVSVKRLLPDRIHIRIEERVPRFWVQKGGVLCYADSEGRIIAPVGSEKFVSLPLLQIDSEAAELVGYMPQVIRAVGASALPLQVDDASRIHLTAGRSVELYMEDKNLRLVFGLDDMDADLRRLSLVFADLGRRGELEGMRDMRAEGPNVWVRRHAAAR
ncbi:FtsQ-type POTRA domain-containing protein [Oleidesulfovibrio alaskensis]|jgi:cell division protein FtsQ